MYCWLGGGNASYRAAILLDINLDWYLQIKFDNYVVHAFEALLEPMEYFP